MSIFNIIMIGIGLAMDAFAVTIAKVMGDCNMKRRDGFLMVALFGLFQGLMPLLGYGIGTQFSYLITSIDHWIAFVLLAVIGVNMIRESYAEPEVDCSLGFKTMLILALATSIDALAVGVGFAFLTIDIIQAALIIAFVTLAVCLIALLFGRHLGRLLGSRAELLGGIILIVIGLKILIEHLTEM